MFILLMEIRSFSLNDFQEVASVVLSHFFDIGKFALDFLDEFDLALLVENLLGFFEIVLGIICLIVVDVNGSNDF